MYKKLFFVISLVLVLASNGLGTTYYVDFDGGSDTNSGLSTSQAWKHCPFDDNATGTSAATTLAGGDTVIFKGGVHYRGEIKANTSGDLGDPIVFDGDTAQTWGSGKAIIDGSEPLTGWTPCSSAEDCGGAANWENMYETTLPSGSDDVWVVNLMEDDVLLAVAQGPTAPDPFFYDKTSSYNSVPIGDATETSIVDASFFTQSDPTAWDDSYIHVWAQGNQVYTVKVTGYSPSTHTIYFETLPNLPYTTYDTLYAMGNSVLVLDDPGEYVVDESGGQVYLWPYTTGDIGNVDITVSVRRTGFDFKGKSYITLQDIKIIKFSGGFGSWDSGAGIKNTTSGANGLIVRNNEVAYNRSMDKFAGVDMRGGQTNVTIENNYIHHNLRSRGLLPGGSNVTVRNNILEKNGGTGIYMGGAHNIDVIGNSVLDHTGVHANGITAYQGSSNILILGNTVLRGNCALTTQCSDSITMAYNILHTYGSGLCVADWSCGTEHSTNLHYYNNVIVSGGTASLYTGGTGLIAKNNIIDGWGASGPNISHNIYTALAWSQYPAYGWYPGVGEIIEEDETKVFVDYANLNYHLKAGSCAIDAGTNIGYSEDIEGNSVPTGSAVDIGVYEYQP
jgi:parallel beta-helix repeat protein